MSEAGIVALLGVALAGAAGIAGAYLGSKIAASATRDAAGIAQADALANREEARRERFADRIVDLTVELLEAASRDLATLSNTRLERQRTGGRPTLPELESPRLVLRLRMLVRSAAMLSAVTELGAALNDMWTTVGLEDLDRMGDLQPTIERFATAYRAVEDGIRPELGQG